MPSTAWSAPVLPLNTSSLVGSGFVTAALTDLSPNSVIVQPGQVNAGTRIRLRAYGEYTATTTASSVTWGFYTMTVGQTFASTAVPLCATASTALLVATAWPWMLEYEGRFISLTFPSGSTNTASVIGQGKAYLPASLTTFTITAMPVTAAARTVTQASANALNTTQSMLFSVGITPAVNTGITSITCDELTLELLG